MKRDLEKGCKAVFVFLLKRALTDFATAQRAMLILDMLDCSAKYTDFDRFAASYAFVNVLKNHFDFSATGYALSSCTY